MAAGPAQASADSVNRLLDKGEQPAEQFLKVQPTGFLLLSETREPAASNQLLDEAGAGDSPGPRERLVPTQLEEASLQLKEQRSLQAPWRRWRSARPDGASNTQQEQEGRRPLEAEQAGACRNASANGAAPVDMAPRPSSAPSRPGPAAGSQWDRSAGGESDSPWPNKRGGCRSGSKPLGRELPRSVAGCFPSPVRQAGPGAWSKTSVACQEACERRLERSTIARP